MNSEASCIALSPLCNSSFQALDMSPGVAIAAWTNIATDILMYNSRLWLIYELALPSHHDLYACRTANVHVALLLADVGNVPYLIQACAGHITLLALAHGNDGSIRLTGSKDVFLGFHPVQVSILAASGKNHHGAKLNCLFCCASDDAFVIHEGNPSASLNYTQLTLDEIDWACHLIAPLADTNGVAIFSYRHQFLVYSICVDCRIHGVNLSLAKKPQVTCVRPVIAISIVYS
jgi:hypothetical protein